MALHGIAERCSYAPYRLLSDGFSPCISLARIKRGMDVLFYYNSTKKWLVKIEKDGQLHTHLGIIKHNDAAGQEFGSRVMTGKEKYVYLMEPTLYDYTMKIQHGTQIVYPKDIGYIVSRAGLRTGQMVVEIGTGSGALTAVVAGIVAPRGRIHTFDVNPDFMKIAEKNIRRAGMHKYTIMHNLDIRETEEPPVTDVDLALIDIGDPWTVMPHVRRMLKGGGGVIAVCPTMNQLEKITLALRENEFTDIECVENLQRAIEAREGKTRHAFQAIGHTTYLCYARKAFFRM